MNELIKVSAAIGIFTLYALVTGAPGLIGYHFLKNTSVDKPVDFTAVSKSLLITYIVGLVVFVWVAVYFVLVRG